MGVHLDIRRARPGDLTGMTALWEKIFGDSGDFVRGFYRAVSPETVLALDGEKIAGMVNIADAALDGRLCGYIYAACVDEEYRGRGLFGALMRFCEYVKPYEYLCLIPASEQLVSMYGHLGYEKLPLEPDFTSEQTPSELDVTADVLYREYLASALPGELLMTAGLFEFMLSDFTSNGGKIGEIGGSAALYREESRKNAVKSIKVYEMFRQTPNSGAIINSEKPRGGNFSSRLAMLKKISDGRDGIRAVMRGPWLDI